MCSQGDSSVPHTVARARPVKASIVIKEKRMVATIYGWNLYGEEIE
jgi:hypothetical protein